MPYAVRDQGILVNGFAGLQRALERIEGGKSNFGLSYELQKRLRTWGETVAKSAPGFVTHRTGRHGGPGNPRLEDAVKVSVTTKSASVYSTALHGGVQNVGGGPHAGWAARGPHVRKANASGWMNRAVASNAAFVEAEMNGLLDWLVREFEAG
jgi:hypothetical protein